MADGEHEEVECDLHGSSLPAFVCVHLMDGDELGFHDSGDVPEDQSRPDAWCGDCEDRRVAEDGWRKGVEPEIALVCATCWDLMRERNLVA